MQGKRTQHNCITKKKRMWAKKEPQTSVQPLISTFKSGCEARISYFSAPKEGCWYE